MFQDLAILLRVKTYTSPGYTVGGGTIRKPRMSISVYLINTKNRNYSDSLNTP